MSESFNKQLLHKFVYTFFLVCINRKNTLVSSVTAVLSVCSFLLLTTEQVVKLYVGLVLNCIVYILRSLTKEMSSMSIKLLKVICDQNEWQHSKWPYNCEYSNGTCFYENSVAKISY
jgi:hypothetical protein